MDNDADKPAFDASFGIQLVKKYNAAKQSKNVDQSRIVEFLMLPANKVTTVVFIFFRLWPEVLLVVPASWLLKFY